MGTLMTEGEGPTIFIVRRYSNSVNGIDGWVAERDSKNCELAFRAPVSHAFIALPVGPNFGTKCWPQRNNVTFTL